MADGIGLVGNQKFTSVGNILPTGTALRVYYVDASTTVSASSITLHNGLVSSTTATIYKIISLGNTGTAHVEWHEGMFFPDGVWLDTGAAGTITTIIGYSRVVA